MTLPPPALDCAHAIEYATVDETVPFEQRRTLNVGADGLVQSLRSQYAKTLMKRNSWRFTATRIGRSLALPRATSRSQKQERRWKGPTMASREGGSLPGTLSKMALFPDS